MTEAREELQVPETDLQKDEEPVPVEKNDFLAMMIAGFITVGIPCVLLILLIIGVTLLLFGGR